MAAPRINYLAANFSYAPLLTKDNYIDALTKFLVSGFGPWGIDKIKVTNKVARVTTSEKRFYSVPGCKLSIGGTNVAAIDDSHQLTEVFNDGFSFNIDTPDGEYTNGVTYSVPSLGWSLVKQTTVTTIYKSGGGVVPFYVIIQKRPVGNFVDNRYDYHLVYIAYELDQNNDPVAAYPLSTSEGAHMLPMHPYTLSFTPDNYNAKMNWFFYGDPAMFIAAGDARTTSTQESIRNGEMGQLSSLVIGESKPLGRNIPVTFMCGNRVSYADLMNNWRAVNWVGNSNSSPALCGYWTTTGSIDTAFIGAAATDGRINFSVGGVAFPKRFYTAWSGNRGTRTASFVTNYQEFTFLPMEVYDNTYWRCGWVPGVYAIDNRPFNIETEPQRKFTLMVNNRARHGVLVRTSSSDSNWSGGGSSAADIDAVAFLDLTGPIR